MRPISCCLVFLASLAIRAGANEADLEIDLDLTAQKATLYQDGDAVYTSPISSGRASHPTPVGDFEVCEKDPDHHSSLYGKLVDGRGHVVKSSADSATPVPSGCHFQQAPMRWFLRFEGAAGMHAGILPGYPASHGCVRMPLEKAKLFYQIAQLGTPVHVHGTPPWRAEEPEGKSHPHETHEAHASPSTPAAPASPSAQPQPKRSLFHWF